MMQFNEQYLIIMNVKAIKQVCFDIKSYGCHFKFVLIALHLLIMFKTSEKSPSQWCNKKGLLPSIIE